MITDDINISVCLATFNGAKYIKEQLDSIILQLGSNDEIIISDDGSVDETIEIIKSYKDSRIKLYNNSFHNYILNFEFTLQKSKGKFVFLSDQDDVWMGNKVEIMLNYLAKYDLVCSDCIVVNDQLEQIRESFYTIPLNKRQGFFSNLIHNKYLGCCMAFNRKVLQIALPFPKKLITHDTWIGLIGELSGSTIFIDNKLMLFRRHNTNTSNTLKGSTLSFFGKIRYRCTILKGLFYNLVLKKNNN